MENQAKKKDSPLKKSETKIQKPDNVLRSWKRSIFRIDDSNSKHKIRMIGSIRSVGSYQTYLSPPNNKINCSDYLKDKEVVKNLKKIYSKSKIKPLTVLIKCNQGTPTKEKGRNSKNQDRAEYKRKTDRSVVPIHEKESRLQSEKQIDHFKVLGSQKKIRSYKKIVDKNSNKLRMTSPIKNQTAYLQMLEIPKNRNGQMVEIEKLTNNQKQTILIKNINNQIRKSVEDDSENIDHQILSNSLRKDKLNQSDKQPSTKIQPESPNNQSIIMQQTISPNVSSTTLQQPQSNSDSPRQKLIPAQKEVFLPNTRKKDCEKTEEQTNKIKIKSYIEPTQKAVQKNKRRASQPFDDKINTDATNLQKDETLYIKPKINKISRQRFKKHQENKEANCLFGIAKQQNQKQLERKADLQYPGVLTITQKQCIKNMVSLPNLLCKHKTSPYNAPMKIPNQLENHKNISIPVSEVSTEKQIKKTPLSNKPTVWINRPEKRCQKSRETSQIESVREHKSEKLLQNGLSIMEPRVHYNFKSQKQISAKRTVTKVKYGRKIDGSSLNEESHSSKKKIEQKNKKQPKKKFDYLRAHSHQFSYLYPSANPNAKDEKLYARLKSLQIKLKGKQNKKEQQEYLNIMKVLLQKQA